MIESTSRTDEAALLGVALAAVISISTAEGEWELIESIVGVVLITVIVSYYDYRQLFSAHGERRKKASFTGVIGLCVCLIAAWPFQVFFPHEALNWLLPLMWATTVAAILITPARRQLHQCVMRLAALFKLSPAL